jgi:hypothetical protein
MKKSYEEGVVIPRGWVLTKCDWRNTDGSAVGKGEVFPRSSTIDVGQCRSTTDSRGCFLGMGKV